MPKKRKIVKDDYDAIAEVFANSYSEINLYKPYIDEFVKNLNGKNILDVGCGAGQFTNYFCELGLNAKGIDFLGFRHVLSETGKVKRFLRGQAKPRTRKKMKILQK